jgi:GAF domain-containing protein
VTADHNPFPPYDPNLDVRIAAGSDTPPGAEARLESYRDELDKAAKALADARNAELDAEEARDAARREAQLSDTCPPVGVFEGRRTTVAYQKAWIEDRVKDEERTYREAKVARQAASDHLRKVGKQGGFQQSLTASVRESYRGTNGRQW